MPCDAAMTVNTNTLCNFPKAELGCSLIGFKLPSYIEIGCLER